MLGKGKFKEATDLYDYLVTGTTGSAPFEVITASEIGSVLERLEWLENAIRRGTGAALPANRSLFDILGDPSPDPDILTRIDHYYANLLEDVLVIFWDTEDIRKLLGDINARTYLKSLLAILGWADVAGVQTLEQRLGYQTSGAVETAIAELKAMIVLGW